MEAIDLSKLSKEEKLRLIDLLDEKNRRKSEKRESFIPNEGQAPVLENVSREDIELVLVLTGNGGGKTALGTNIAIDSASGYNPHNKQHTPVPVRVIVVLDKPEKVTDVWLQEIKKWYPLKADQLYKRGKPYVTQIQFPNGSEILFQFHDQDPMSFESIEGDVFIFDEPPPRHVFIALRRAGRKKGRKPKYVIIGTPLAAPWLRKEIYEPWSRGERPDVMCFRYSTMVNEDNLSEGYVDQFGKYLTDKEKRIRLHGEFFDLEGLALAHLFDQETHLIEDIRWPHNWPTVCVIDFHSSKPSVAILVGVTPEDEFVYLKEMHSRSLASEFASELKDFYQGYRVTDIVCDSLGSSDLTGGEGRLSFIQVLKDRGVRVRATTYQEKQDEAFIQMIQESLKVPEEPDRFGNRYPRLRFVKGQCKGAVYDIETVEWQKVKNVDQYKPKLAIDKKDYLACIKYFLATQPSFKRERVIPKRDRTVVSYGKRRRRI